MAKSCGDFAVCTVACTPRPFDLNYLGDLTSSIIPQGQFTVRSLYRECRRKYMLCNFDKFHHNLISVNTRIQTDQANHEEPQHAVTLFRPPQILILLSHTRWLEQSTHGDRHGQDSGILPVCSNSESIFCCASLPFCPPSIPREISLECHRQSISGGLKRVRTL